MAIKAIDLFSGCGGVSCGLTQAGLKVKAAVEIENSAADIYHNYLPLADVCILRKDICNVTGQELFKSSHIKKDDLYLLAGCPPCQNFSMQNPKNKDKPESERKKLLFEYLRIIEEMHPPFILMENVPGIATEFNKPILEEFIGRLENKTGDDSKKYFIQKKVLNAADYGVPQVRKRFVLHGVRMDIYRELLDSGIAFALPAPTHSKSGSKNLLPWVTVVQAIGDLPAINAGEEYVDPNGLIHNHKCANLSDENILKIEYIRQHGGSRDCLPDNMTLECHKKKDTEGKSFGGHKDVYGIMNPDKPSPTMTGGCLCYTKGRYGHYAQNRAISIREAARFQTFPNDFVFSNNLGEAALQIGNAVPVKLVEASAGEIMKSIKALKHIRRSKKKTEENK